MYQGCSGEGEILVEFHECLLVERMVILNFVLINSVGIESYNQMKKDMEVSKRTSQKLISNVNLWKRRCQKLKKDLNVEKLER